MLCLHPLQSGRHVRGGVTIKSPEPATELAVSLNIDKLRDFNHRICILIDLFDNKDT